MQESVIAYPWAMTTPPPGATVWPMTVGQLTGYGDSRRTNILQYVHPHLVIRGRGTFVTPYETREVQAGDLFCIWPDVPHDFYEAPDDPWQFFWLQLIGPGAVEFAGALGLAPHALVRRPALPQRAEQLFAQLFTYYGAAQMRDPFHVLALLYDWAAAVRGPAHDATTGASARQLVDDAKALMEAMLETGLNVAGLARQLGISRNHLLAAFQQEAGESPIAYLRAARLLRAKELLAGTTHSLAAIAAACGYGHVKYFLRCFRDAEGITPGAWRKQKMGSENMMRKDRCHQ